MRMLEALAYLRPFRALFTEMPERGYLAVEIMTCALGLAGVLLFFSEDYGFLDAICTWGWGGWNKQKVISTARLNNFAFSLVSFFFSFSFSWLSSDLIFCESTAKSRGRSRATHDSIRGCRPLGRSRDAENPKIMGH